MFRPEAPRFPCSGRHAGRGRAEVALKKLLEDVDGHVGEGSGLKAIPYIVGRVYG